MALPVTVFTHLSQSMPVGGRAAGTTAPHVLSRSRWQNTPVINDIRLTRGDLLEMNGARGADAQTRNALSTAHDALGVIGGLLANVGTVLRAAASGDASFDLKTDQARIDGAVATIDSVAISTTFGGRKLLDGAYSARTGTGLMTLPSFGSSELGKGGDGAGQAMKSLASGGINDLSSGRHEIAGTILINAIHQVSRTQASLDAAVGKKVADTPVIEGHGDAMGWLKLAARETLSDPEMSVAAVANSEPRDVLGLIA